MLLVQQISKHQILLGVYFIVAILFLVSLFLLFFFTFQRRKNTLLLNQVRREQEFQKALAQSAHEIKEQTLKNIGMELHDNVGQLLSVAKMQINMGLNVLPEQHKEVFEDARDTVGQSLSEIRSLSKVINGEVMAQWQLSEAIREEVKRLQKSGIVTVDFKTEGVLYPIENTDKIIIFRIVQECCSNVVKHAQASRLSIHMYYLPELLHIHIKDNGVGFEVDENGRGSGMINMKNRAELIHAELTFDSAIDKGTSIHLKYVPQHDPPQRHISR